MRKYMFFLAVVFAPLVRGQTNVHVYEADETTPFDNRDIMAGTKLTFIVTSDSNDYWSGGLFLRGTNRDLAVLSARGYDANTWDYTASHLEKTGHFANVTRWQDSSIWGFDMHTFYPIYGDHNSNNTEAGDWFIIDYTAQQAGQCSAEFYDYSVSWNEPVYNLTFTQITSRDFNNDGKVDFRDYAILASNWIRVDCTEPNWCGSTDLNMDGNIDYTDLIGFIDFWLWSELPPPDDGNEPPIPVDPNIIICIVDAEDSNEITIDVNESITLYLKLTTTQQGNLGIFDFEAVISDANLGSIDNREYHPNDPNDPNNGTARILAEPRDSLFDYIGPGYAQPAGITLAAAKLGADFNDGNLASFVFTCNGQGDVTLSLKNYLTDIHPKLESILIHQSDSNLLSMMMTTCDSGIETQSSQISEDIDTNELVVWLEEIWVNDPNVREITTEDDWFQFIETVQESEDSY